MCRGKNIRNTQYAIRVILVLLLCLCSVCLGASEESQDEAVKAVLDLLRSGDPDMQTIAITMVREMPGKEVTEALVKELARLSATGQVQLLSALADRGDETALPAVVSSMKAEDVSVRVAALKALGQLGDASNVTLLAEVAAPVLSQESKNGGKAEEQKAARESLYRLRGSEVDKQILTQIPSANPKVKVELIRAIGQRNIKEGVETLLRATQDSNSQVQLESFKVLKVIADQRYLKALVYLLIEVESVSVRRGAEKTVAAVALKIEDENRRADTVLTVLSKVVDVEKRCSLLRVLSRIGNDVALVALRAVLRSDDAKEKDTAIRALSDWPDPKPMNDLLTIAKNSDNDIHRILALRGFVRMIGLEDNRPAEETVMMYRQAMELSTGPREKKLVISGLANVKSSAALEMAASYLEDTALQQEAEIAVVKIAESIYKDYPQQTTDVLNKIIETSKNDSLRQLAQDIVKKINEKQ